MGRIDERLQTRGPLLDPPEDAAGEDELFVHHRKYGIINERSSSSDGESDSPMSERLVKG